MKPNRWLILGGLTGLLGVLFGAFGAHGIEEAIPSWYSLQDLPPVAVEDQSQPAPLPAWYQLDQLHLKKLQTWKTGVRYHFYHALAVIAVGLILAGSQSPRHRLLDLAAVLFLLGIVGFSGSIYVYVVSKIKIFGMTAALGGLILVGGWIFFVWGVMQLSTGGRESDS